MKRPLTAPWAEQGRGSGATLLAPPELVGERAPVEAPETAPQGRPSENGRLLRILVINWQDRENPQAGGAEAHLHAVFGRLAAWGDQVTLLCSGFPGAPARTSLDSMEVHRVGGRYSFFLKARRYFFQHLRQRSYHVLVEDLNKVSLFTPTWSRVPVLLLVHHLFGRTAFQEARFPLAVATWLLERPLPRVFRGVPVVAVSQSTAEDLVGRGFPAGQVRVVPNGVALERLTPDPDGRRFEAPTVLYLGRLKRYKRVDLILRALARLHEQGIPAHLLIAGEGDHRRALESLCQRLELSGQVRFLGFVPEERKLELLRRSWVHVLTSPKEGWGISNLEAAACGTPTVASDSPGLKDSVVHGQTGYLVPHGDVQALSSRLSELLLDGTTREAMGRGARRFAEAFTWDSAARGMREAIAERLAGGKGWA